MQAHYHLAHPYLESSIALSDCNNYYLIFTLFQSLKSIAVDSYKIAKLQENIPRNRFDNVYSCKCIVKLCSLLFMCSFR